MKKVALINPNSPFLISDGDRPPLNLAYLANQINKKHEVVIFDFAIENPKILLKEILDYKPEIIGFTATTPVFFQAVNILQAIQEIADFKFVSVLGGVHATVLSKMCLKYFDYVFMGEAENTFRAFCDGDSYVKGNIAMDSSVEVNGLLPARDLLPVQKYSMQLDGKKCTTIITSRGCPYNCVFCSSILGKKVRCNSAENVVNEIESIINNYNIFNFYFLDDVFTFNKQRVFDICRLIKERGLNIGFRVTTRINLVDKAILEALRAVGCKMVCYGLESGVDRVLRAYNKGFTVKDIKNVVGMTKEVGIGIKAFWVQSSFEKKIDKQLTKRLIKQLGLKQNDLYDLIVYPGSKLWQDKYGKWNDFNVDFFKNYYHGGKNE